MHCPSCGHNGMLFDSHHGMEHNVCEQCGTVVECESLVVDIFQPGSRDVPLSYHCKPKSNKCRSLHSATSKTFTESLEMMSHLMDKLNLPTAARELAVQFLQYTKSLDRRCGVGACVYMAMKRHDIPVTIKYISNYLEVSHFLIGRAMKKLEVRIGESARSKVFTVDRLAHLIFNQAKFGGSDGGKKRFDLLLSKTEQLLKFLLEVQSSINFQPHIIVLAAGYIVWRNLNRHGWSEINDGNSSNELEMTCLKRETIKSFLSEVGIKLSGYWTFYEKVNVIVNLLSKFASHIPWISSDMPPKDMVYCHLDDFLKLKSQILSLVAQEKPEDTQLENLNEVQKEGLSKSCDQMDHEQSELFVQTKQSGPSMLGDCKVSSANRSAEEDFKTNVMESSPEEGTSKCKFSLNSDPDLDYASMLLEAESGEKDTNKNGLVFRKIRYTKLTNLRHVPYKHEKLELHCSDSKNCQNSNIRNDCEEILKNGSPKADSCLTNLSFP